jgi:hypothetical protein
MENVMAMRISNDSAKDHYEKWLKKVEKNPNLLISREEIITFIETNIYPDRFKITKPIIKHKLLNARMPENHAQILSEEALFRMLARLNWQDRQDKIMTERDIRCKFVRHEAKSILNTVHTMIPILKVALETNPQLKMFIERLTQEQFNDFSGHIIAKGKEFYHGVLVDASFAEYIINEYQSFVTMMKNFSQAID